MKELTSKKIMVRYPDGYTQELDEKDVEGAVCMEGAVVIEPPMNQPLEG